MKISKVFVGILATMICLAVSFSSCKKETNLSKEITKEFPRNLDTLTIEIMEIDSTINNMRAPLVFQNWGSFQRLQNLESPTELSAGVYAVKVTCSSGATVGVFAKNYQDPTSYTWAYIFDDEANQISFSGIENLCADVARYFEYQIAGDESLVLVLHVMQTGDFHFHCVKVGTSFLENHIMCDSLYFYQHNIHINDKKNN